MIALVPRNSLLFYRYISNQSLRTFSCISNRNLIDANTKPYGKTKSLATVVSGHQFTSNFLSNNLQSKSIKFQFSNKMSSDVKNDAADTKPNLSTKDKLKKAVKEYGSTVIVFHVAISLMSLGGFYLLVSSGVDVVAMLDWIGINTSKFVAGTSTFVLAYAIHKVFAPVRISITLGATPIIVRYLRKRRLVK